MSNERLNLDTIISEKNDWKLLYISSSKYEGDWQSLPHSHHFAELFYVVRGKGNFLAGQEKIPVKAQDLVLVNPNIPHTELPLDSNPLEYIVFGVEGLSFTFRDRLDGRDCAVFSELPHKKELPTLFELLLSELSEKQDGYEAVCRHVLDLILVFLSRTNRIQVQASASLALSNECALIKRYLDLNYHQAVTLDELAELAHTNKYYLSHIFTEQVGLSPIQYLIDRRLTAAKELLNSTDLSIAQIASSTGFASQSYFAQSFNKCVGQSPNQYRKAAAREKTRS